MIKCLICGKEKEYSIVEHIKYEHNLTSDEYKKKYNTEVKSKKLKNMVSDTHKRLWSDPKYKNKMSIIHKKSHNTIEYKNKAKEITQLLWKNPKFRKNQIEKKNTPEFLEAMRHPDRVEKIRKTSKERWKDPEYKKRLSKKMKQVINDKNGGYRKYLSSNKWKQVRKQISETISRKIANGEIGFKTGNHFKTGWYNGFWYQSSLELGAMKFFDEIKNVIKWTNKHGIRIKYKHPDGIERFYIPDFLIKLKNDKELLIEMKGFGDKDEIKAKKIAAEKIYNNYHLIYSIKELEEIIEANKNKKYIKKSKTNI